MNAVARLRLPQWERGGGSSHRAHGTMVLKLRHPCWSCLAKCGSGSISNLCSRAAVWAGGRKRFQSRSECKLCLEKEAEFNVSVVWEGQNAAVCKNSFCFFAYHYLLNPSMCMCENIKMCTQYLQARLLTSALRHYLKTEHHWQLYQPKISV